MSSGRSDILDPWSWLAPHGEAAARIRATDWSASPLGPPEDWPQSLRTAINVVLSSKFPMYVWWGPEQVNIYNDSYSVIAGPLRHPKLFGRPAREMWPEIWTTMRGFLDEVHRTGQAVLHEDLPLTLERKGVREENFFTFSFAPAFDETGAVRGAIAIVQETTSLVNAQRERARAEEETRRARQELHDFLMQAPIGIALLSGREHVYTLVNPYYTSLLFEGRTEADFLGKTIRQALPELAGQGFYEILDEVYRTGKPFMGAKLRASVRQTSGADRELYVNFSYQPKRDPAGNIDGILVVVYEVTDQVNEQKEIELLAQNLRAAVVSRDTFLGIASHELNTPLTALKLQTQLHKRQLARLGSAAVSKEGFERLLDSTLSQVNRMSLLVNDMLDASRISSGKLTMSFTDEDLSALVRGVVDRFATQFETAGCAVTAEIAEGLHATVDAARIEQVIINFVTNAIKYAPGAPVLVKVERAGPAVRVSLRDSGDGIAAENQERIFGRFERAAAVSGVSGLGLGLYICRQIIQEHGGRIFVESQPGRGATFAFELPLATRPGAP